MITFFHNVLVWTIKNEMELNNIRKTKVNIVGPMAKT